jgi:hypothetical protein
MTLYVWDSTHVLHFLITDAVSPALGPSIRVAQKVHTASMSHFRALMEAPFTRRSDITNEQTQH